MAGDREVRQMAWLRVALSTRVANVATLAQGLLLELTREQFLDLAGRAYDEQKSWIAKEQADIEALLARDDDAPGGDPDAR
jgi:hypothetical protein